MSAGPGFGEGHPPGSACATYLRVSTDKQDLDSQREDVERYVTARGWRVARVYEERMSGAQDRRPALAELMADARRRRFRAVVVWSLDRFGRSLPQIVVNVQELAALGVEFASIKQVIDLSTMQGRLTLYVFAMLAEVERDMIAQRVRAGLAATRARSIDGSGWIRVAASALLSGTSWR